MVDPIQLPIPTPPPNADAHARADTERNRRLFDWAEAVLKALGLDPDDYCRSEFRGYTIRNEAPTT